MVVSKRWMMLWVGMSLAGAGHAMAEPAETSTANSSSANALQVAGQIAATPGVASATGARPIQMALSFTDALIEATRAGPEQSFSSALASGVGQRALKSATGGGLVHDFIIEPGLAHAAGHVQASMGQRFQARGPLIFEDYGPWRAAHPAPGGLVFLDPGRAGGGLIWQSHLCTTPQPRCTNQSAPLAQLSRWFSQPEHLNITCLQALLLESTEFR